MWEPQWGFFIRDMIFLVAFMVVFFVVARAYGEKVSEIYLKSIRSTFYLLFVIGFALSSYDNLAKFSLPENRSTLGSMYENESKEVKDHDEEDLYSNREALRENISN